MPRSSEKNSSPNIRSYGRPWFFLASMLSLFVIHPLISEFVAGVWLLDIFLTLVFLAATAALASKRWEFGLIGLLAVAAVTMRWLQYMESSPYFWPIELACSIGFLVMISLLLFKEVLKNEPVSADKIALALNLYLVLGLVWAYVYGLIDMIHPNGFDFGDHSYWAAFQESTQHHALTPYVYFSFVTLTTLGYGDITPNCLPAATLASLEALSGQIFMTVLVARLVGLHISNPK